MPQRSLTSLPPLRQINEIAADVLQQASRDYNLLPLPEGTRSTEVQEVEGVLQRKEVPNTREMQIQFDGLGWTSRVGSTRLIARTPQTVRNHNSTRYGRDAVFCLGKDKNPELHKMNELGGEASLKSRLAAGIKVTKRDVADLPAHVQEDPLFAALACFE